MSRKRNKPTRRPADKADQRKQAPDEPVFPDKPPMQDRRLPWWPLIVMAAILLAWLIFLGILASYSGRWGAE